MLYAHQKKFLSRNPDKSSLIWSCGTGKTKTAIEWAKGDTLVICPKSLKENWIREFYASKKRGVFTIVTKEEFRRDYLTLCSTTSIIVDEVHNGFLTPHFKSAMSKALRDYIKAHNVPRVLLLTATPYTSSPWNIFNLATLTGHKWDWYKFKTSFFNDVWMGPRMIPIPKKGVEKQLAKLIPIIADVVDIHDVMDVPLQNHTDPEYFSLTAGQENALGMAYDPLPIVRYTKQHEIENGILKNDEGVWVTFPSHKVDRIVSLCQENPKIAIICRYNTQIDLLKSTLTDLKFSPIYIINGHTNHPDATCRAAEAAEKAIVLIQADCAEGYELPSFELVVFASQSYSYVKWEQLCGRFLRMNKPSRTTFLYLLSSGKSVDQGVYDSIRKKEDFKIELFK